MTDLQVRYNQFKETERANRAAEELRSQEVAVKEREATVSELEQAMKERKVPFEVQKLVSDAKLSDAQRESVLEGILKIQAEIDRIKADTTLSKQEAMLKQQEILKGIGRQAENIIYNISGGPARGLFADILDAFAGSIIGGPLGGFMSLIK